MLAGLDTFIAVWHFEVKVIVIIIFFGVRMYYRKNAIYQGFCPDWPV